MADVNYSVVDFNDLSAVSDGKTLLYSEDGQVCKSDRNLSDIVQSAVDKQVENKLDTSAFSTVSGDFLTQQSLDGYATETWVNDQGFLTEHQEIPESANWTKSYETVTANSGTWNNVSSIKSFTSIAGIAAETSADSLQITNGDNVSITTANKTITISAKDTTYDENDFISASHLDNIVTASGYAKVWSDNSATIIANGNSGVSALNTITANSAAWTNGAFVTANLTQGENPVPDIQHPTNKFIYLTKEEGSELKDPYTEWIYSDKWEIIGETTVDLSDYYSKNETSSKDDLATEFAKKLDSSAAETTYAPISLTATVNTLTGSSATWNEVSAKVDTSSMSSYYQKSETSGSTEISAALSGKEDKLSFGYDSSDAIISINSSAIGGGNTYNAGSMIQINNNTIDINNNSCSASANKYSIAIGSTTLASGSYSFAQGVNTTAYGSPNMGGGAHAEGLMTYAGDYAHAEGYNTRANGYNHAEGYNTSAMYMYSHAEGKETLASNEGSHAEGNQTSATGNYSHTEGWKTIATKNYSHAEGYYTSANGDYSHSEGYYTLANGEMSHSEGMNTSAIGPETHAEGWMSISVGHFAHAEGYSTSAVGSGTHTEGDHTVANGDFMHVCGTYNDTKSGALFVVGNGSANNSRSDAFIIDLNGNVTASGNIFTSAGNVVATNSTPTANQVLSYNGTNVVWSDVQGGGTTYTAGTDIKIENDTISVNNMDCSAVANIYSVAIGLSTSALSYGSFTQGENTLANIGRVAHAEGLATQALGNYSHSEGSNTSATGEDSHSEGYYTKATERYSHAEGRSTSAQGEDSHAEGYSTSAVGKHAHAEGEYSKATGETSHSEGYDTSAIGNYAHAEGYQTIANSNYSHSEGQETSALGICSHAEGYRTKAGSMYMHVCGKYNQTSSNALFVIGNGNANNSRSDAFIVTENGNTSANDFISNGVSLSGMIDLYNILTARPLTGTHTLKCVNGILSWVEDSNVPANAVGLNNEPVGVNGDYFTVGEGQ